MYLKRRFSICTINGNYMIKLAMWVLVLLWVCEFLTQSKSAFQEIKTHTKTSHQFSVCVYVCVEKKPSPTNPRISRSMNKYESHVRVLCQFADLVGRHLLVCIYHTLGNVICNQNYFLGTQFEEFIGVCFVIKHWIMIKNLNLDFI